MLIIIIVRINKSLFYCNKLSKTNILLWEGGGGLVSDRGRL